MIQALSNRREGDASLWRRGRILLTGIGLLCVVSIVFLVSEIVQELRFLNSASSDNVHWVLSQSEVELLEFENAVIAAQQDSSQRQLDFLVVEFDVFYSRMTTLAVGSLYTDLRAINEFGQPIAEIRAKLENMIPVIDGSADQLRQGLPLLHQEANEIRPLLRRASTTGLQYFAELSDRSRASVSWTLLRLALITVALLMALVILLGHTRRVSKETENHGYELADAYARLNTILETSLDAVVVSDLDGRILNFNSAAERIFQHSFDDVVGKNIGEIIIPDHLKPAHDAGMKRMRETGEQKVVGHGRVRLEAKRKNGEVFPVELALEKAQADDDELVVAFLRDISHRVASENELVEARDKALAGEKAKAEFLAMMTHEIRTPLNGLLGNLALLEKTHLSKGQDRYVRNMGLSGETLMHHVDAVLDVARFESGTSTSKEEVVHLGQLVQGIVDAQASAAEANGNHIQWGWLDEPLEWVRIDASRLQQVLLNLVGNAIKFTHDGRISIEMEQSRLTGEERALEMRVIDSGIGISDENQERIFDDFQTIDDANVAGVSGTGLGLGIARRFIEAMGGEIGVESTPGEGSVFWLRIPVAPETGPKVSHIPEQPVQVVPCDLLLVEDNEINLEVAREMLVSHGHTVTVARDGEEAVETANTRRFDLILMDIRMPKLDGLGATRLIREGGGVNHDAPIIAFSANVLPEAKDRFTAAGMTGFLPKPLNENELRQVLAKFGPGADHSHTTDKPKVEKPMEHAVELSPLEKLKHRHIDETRDLFDWLASAPSDHNEIAERAHKVAGSAAAFGQSGLREALVAVEMAAEAGDGSALDSALESARKAWQDAPEPTLA
ncbi:PAS domain-containing hybrid sensor histidine kinase/response regulator [Thalassococcus lentus]|uniref:histidine kinase n=1 Tax=Thalassococcus lentus TaxID=1210524 RepID=A0ABT4XPS8_9RHOB|nr:PAS domain-containing hybrid sensor histidine kinase/response regulator [Thalassococcus lentus]MDA7423942.1 ATP-binding protein [Thalassococcus lentus]